jgi:signal transduction histidine kinase
MNGFSKNSSGQLRWVILLLAVAVILPTVCLLWFMNSAVKNERLAVRQRLVSSYAESLEKLKEFNEDIWLKLTDIPARTLSEGAPDFLTAIVRTQNYGKGDYDHGDAVVVYDANGAMLYPVMEDYQPDVADVNESLWRLEFVDKNCAAAALEYQEIADESADEATKLYAQIAAVRNLKKAGDVAAALKECGRIFEAARQPDTRQFNPLMQLRIMQIQLSKDVVSSDYPNLVERFLDQAIEYTEIRDYAAPRSDSVPLPSVSRIFFLRRAVDFARATLNIAPDKIQLAEKLLAAEFLSLEMADKYPDASLIADWPERTARKLDHRSDLFGYVLADSTKKALIVFNTDNLRLFFEIYATSSFPKDLNYTITDDTGRRVLGIENPPAQALLKYPVSKYFPRWEISVFLKDNDLFASAAEKQTAVYVWAGVLVVALILVTGGFAGRALGRQMKLNRLKNDFIATVTHELKTPLASMRVLADTLLDGNYKDQQQAKEYLELICKENRRLSGLIDNFLTFSRMERNKRAFDMSPTSPADIASAAADAVKTKFAQYGCHLRIEIAEDLPDVPADRDAMATVLVNLLDNACKYSYDDKQMAPAILEIELKAFAEDGLVCFSVNDNGIGMTRRQIRKIFDRFYQADRSLSRRAEGCGLGLSIAKFIVDAHKGTITVESKPGKGSTFTVKLPAPG